MAAVVRTCHDRSAVVGVDPEKEPACVFLFSGKRKSGKDFTTDLFLERYVKQVVLNDANSSLSCRLPDEAQILRLSGPLKGAYAKVIAKKL